jgi:hypothetical protein
LEHQPSDAKLLGINGDAMELDVDTKRTDANNDDAKNKLSTGFKAPAGRGMHWLEGSFLTVIQLAKHGGVAFVSGAVAAALPFVLRVQECPDREFRTRGEANADLHQVPRVPPRAPRVVVAGTLEGMRDGTPVARSSRRAQVLPGFRVPPLVHAVNARDGQFT